MSPITVFYDGEVFAESNKWIDTEYLQVGAYVRDARTSNRCWHRVVGNASCRGVISVNECDIPKWIKAWILILT